MTNQSTNVQFQKVILQLEASGLLEHSEVLEVPLGIGFKELELLIDDRIDQRLDVICAGKYAADARLTAGTTRSAGFVSDSEMYFGPCTVRATKSEGGFIYTPLEVVPALTLLQTIQTARLTANA